MTLEKIRRALEGKYDEYEHVYSSRYDRVYEDPDTGKTIWQFINYKSKIFGTKIAITLNNGNKYILKIDRVEIIRYTISLASPYQHYNVKFYFLNDVMFEKGSDLIEEITCLDELTEEPHEEPHEETKEEISNKFYDQTIKPLIVKVIKDITQAIKEEIKNDKS